MGVRDDITFLGLVSMYLAVGGPEFLSEVEVDVEVEVEVGEKAEVVEGVVGSALEI